MELAGKKAVVFGGTSGIGLATCKLLLDLQAQVVAISREPNKACELQGAELVACDVRDRNTLERVFAEQAPFDILISAATGGDRAIGPFMQMELDAYQASFDKLWGYTNVVQIGVPYLNNDGAIVLVSQIALASVGAAVEQFARTVASEIAPKRINVVSPGVIATPMYGAEPEEVAQMLANATAKNTIPRAGRSSEVAQAIIFAVQNDFVTGTTIDVDGGWLIS